MKCPMKWIAKHDNADCYAECAWYIEGKGCAVAVLATQIQLVDIVFSEEMTREEATEALK